MLYILIALIFLGGFGFAWAICAAGARADEELEKMLRELNNVL